MDQTQLKTWIGKVVADAVFEETGQVLTVTVEPAAVHTLISRLKDDPQTRFGYLFCISGADWNGKLTVIYHLESIEWGHQVVVKTGTSNRDNPQVPSICDLYKGAELHENEIFDLFGITFTGHPNLRRMFMPDDWKGYPLRKDYSDPVNIVDLT